jgi:hypothetical protein
MAKDLSVSDFPVAQRRGTNSQAKQIEVDQPVSVASVPAKPVNEPEGKTADQPASKAEAPVRAPTEAKPGLLTEQARDQRTARDETRRVEAQDSQNRLRNLARKKTRMAKHFVNVPLDAETKQRLERAAHENGIKMTVIMKDAIATYLSEAGY